MATPDDGAELVELPAGPAPVEIHALGQVWHAGDLHDATAETWRDLMADMLCDVAANLRGER